MSNETPPFRDHPAVRAVIGFGRAPDPVDAAIERHRAAREELQRAAGGVDAASNADGAAWADLLATRPGDVPGAVRLLRYVSGSPASEVVEDPQDLLRQLLAAVEAGETGRPAGEGEPGCAGPQVVAEPDPALAVVAEYRAAWDGLGAAIEAAGGAGVPMVPEAEAADSAAYTRLRTVRPTTPAGFRALAETWAWRLQAERIAVEDGEPGSTASHAAASLIAGAGVCLPGSADAPVSPALAELIARHRDLVRRSEARGLSDAVADPLFDEAWSVFRQACSFPIAGPADLAAKVDLMAAEITEGVERGETDTGTHAWNCLRADLLSLRGVELAGAAESTEEPVDWYAPPPGFMASPAIEPFGFALIPHGIAIELGRLRSIALAEFERRSAVGMTPEGEERLRRDLHLDTLSKAARGESGFAVWPVPGAEAVDVRDGQANPRLCALVTAWEAAERAGNASGLSDEERAPLIDHASGLLRDVYAFPAHTMADICAKLPAYRDEAANTGDAPDAPDSEVTLEACALRGLVADLERLAGGRETGAIGEPVAAAVPDPVLAAIAASRKAELHMEMFQRSLDGWKPAGWQDREKEHCRAQRDAREAVWHTVPTTHAGRRALVEYARFQVEVHAGETGIIDNAKALFEEILAPIAAAIEAERPDAASAGAETLVERLLATWAALARAEDASDDGTSEVLLEHRAALLREAERLPATRPHLIAKALAFAWIGHAHLWRVGQAREDYAIDGRLALDIEATARVPAGLES